MMFYKENDFKDTAAGKIPSDWDVFRLEEILYFRNGERPQISDNGVIPVFGANGIMGYTNEALVDNDFTIIVGRVGASGQIHLGEGKIWVSDNAIYSEKYEKTRTFLPFLYYLLTHKKLNQFASKTTHPIITQTFLNNFQIYLPPLEEQEAIVGVLGVVDSAVGLVDRVILKTERLKKGLMQTLLTRGIGHKEYKYSKELRHEIPNDWEVKTLLDAVGGEEDNIVAGPFGSNLKVADYKDEGVPIIRLQNIEHGRFINKDIKYISPEKAEELRYHSFVKGDIVLAKLGDPIGKTCIVPEYLEKGIVVADVVRIRVNELLLNKKYAMYILNSFYIYNQLNRETIGTTRPRVNLEQIRKLFLPIPPLSEQQKISEILSAVDRKLEIEEKEKARLERIKQGLMDLLLTGKIRVKVD